MSQLRFHPMPILTDTGMGVRDKQVWVFEEFNNLTEIDIGHSTAT